MRVVVGASEIRPAKIARIPWIKHLGRPLSQNTGPQAPPAPPRNLQGPKEAETPTTLALGGHNTTLCAQNHCTTKCTKAENFA